MVANRILARFLASMRRSRRVSSRTAIGPIPGRVTERVRLLSPIRIAGGPPMLCLLRSRNDGRPPVFFLKRGNPTCLPLRLPERESDQAFSPLPRSTAASSNTCWRTRARQARPVTTVSTVPSVSYGEDPAGVLGFLPGIEGVDQIEPAPRHVGVRVGLALGERGFHQRQALVERKPRRPGMSGQHLVLLDVGVEAEIECGVPAHLIGEHPTAHRQQPDLA